MVQVNIFSYVSMKTGYGYGSDNWFLNNNKKK